MISVVACTNREEFVPRLIRNFEKQTLAEKELILVVNSTAFTVDGKGGTVLRYPEVISLGECLNRGASLAKYEYVAKMDDDDFYSPDYLEEAYQALISTGADMVGKSSFYVYFNRDHELRLYNPYHENKWIAGGGPYKSAYFLSGATLVFKKEIVSKLRFPDVSLGEDSGFQRLCYENGLKLYSLSKDHYAYVRYQNPGHHHSDVTDPLLKRRSRFIANTPSLEHFFEKRK